jgi:hypothetical protein
LAFTFNNRLSVLNSINLLNFKWNFQNLFLRKILFLIFIVLFISLGFFNDLSLGPYYIVALFIITLAII